MTSFVVFFVVFGTCCVAAAPRCIPTTDVNTYNHKAEYQIHHCTSTPYYTYLHTRPAKNYFLYHLQQLRCFCATLSLYCQACNK